MKTTNIIKPIILLSFIFILSNISMASQSSVSSSVSSVTTMVNGKQVTRKIESQTVNGITTIRESTVETDPKVISEFSIMPPDPNVNQDFDSGRVMPKEQMGD